MRRARLPDEAGRADPPDDGIASQGIFARPFLCTGSANGADTGSRAARCTPQEPRRRSEPVCDTLRVEMRKPLLDRLLNKGGDRDLTH